MRQIPAQPRPTSGASSPSSVANRPSSSTGPRTPVKKEEPPRSTTLSPSLYSSFNSLEDPSPATVKRPLFPSERPVAEPAFQQAEHVESTDAARDEVAEMGAWDPMLESMVDSRASRLHHDSTVAGAPEDTRTRIEGSLQTAATPPTAASTAFEKGPHPTGWEWSVGFHRGGAVIKCCKARQYSSWRFQAKASAHAGPNCVGWELK